MEKRHGIVGSLWPARVFATGIFAFQLRKMALLVAAALTFHSNARLTLAFTKPSSTRHPMEPQAECHRPGCLPVSSPHYHETAVSNLLPPRELLTTTSSNVSSAQGVHDLYTRFLRATRAHWTETEYRQLPRSYVEPGVGRSLQGPRRLRFVWVTAVG